MTPEPVWDVIHFEELLEVPAATDAFDAMIPASCAQAPPVKPARANPEKATTDKAITARILVLVFMFLPPLLSMSEPKSL